MNKMQSDMNHMQKGLNNVEGQMRSLQMDVDGVKKGPAFRMAPYFTHLANLGAQSSFPIDVDPSILAQGDNVTNQQPVFGQYFQSNNATPVDARRNPWGSVAPCVGLPQNSGSGDSLIHYDQGREALAQKQRQEEAARREQEERDRQERQAHERAQQEEKERLEREALECAQQEEERQAREARERAKQEEEERQEREARERAQQEEDRQLAMKKMEERTRAEYVLDQAMKLAQELEQFLKWKGECVSSEKAQEVQDLIRRVDTLVGADDIDLQALEETTKEMTTIFKKAEAKAQFIEKFTNFGCFYVGRRQDKELDKLLRKHSTTYAFFFNYEDKDKENEQWELFIKLMHCREEQAWTCVLVSNHFVIFIF